MGFLFGTSVALADGAAAAETSDFSLNVGETLMGLVRDTGFGAFFVGDGWKMLVMIIIGCVLLYLAIHKGFEPLLLLPIGFGMILSNLPLAGLMDEGGLLYYLYKGVKLGIYPPLIFLGVGAMTDFGPLIANPKSLFLGAAAQLGIFIAFTGAILLGRSPELAASIGIIGGADGPTAIYVTSKLAPEYLGSIAVAAYSYMALVPSYPAPDHEGSDYQGRAHDKDGAAPPGFQEGNDSVPDHGYYRRVAAPAVGCAAGGYADAG